MKTVMSKPVTIFLAGVLLFSAIGFARKPTLSPDTKFYLSLSDRLQTAPADVVLSTKKATWTVVTLPALLSVTRPIFPTTWPWVFVGLNVLCAAIALAALVALVKKVTGSTIATTAAFLFFAGAYDIVMWLSFVLTDLIFNAIALGCFYVVVTGVVNADASWRRRGKLGLLLVLAFITRASGAILIPVAIFAEWWAHRTPPKRTRPFLPWAFLFVLAATGLLVRAYFFADMQRWPTHFLKPILQLYADREDGGEVVWDRKETFHAPPQGVVDHVSIELDRFVRFFQFTAPTYSRVHKLINVAYYVPLYVLALLGFVAGLRRGGTRGKVVVITGLWIASLAWLHAMTILDYDWRYRLPAMPMLILLAACGVESIALRFGVRSSADAVTAGA